MNRLVVLVGAHSSGKTTLGTALAKRLGWRFDDEIGYRLRMEAIVKDRTQLADVSQVDFDRRVYEQECLRDSCRVGDAVIETWHGGNLAYVHSRSAEAYHQLKKGIENHLKTLEATIIVVPLQLKLSTLKKRQHEEVSDVQFFYDVGQLAHFESQWLNLFVVDPVRTDNRSVTECLDEIVDKISRGY